MTTTLNLIVFIILGIVFDLYIILLLLRFLLTFFGADFYNPISHYVYNFTRLFVRPLQRIIPIYKRIDFATLILIFLFEFIKILLLVWLRFDRLPGFSGLPLWALGEILNQLINVYFYALLIRAVLSWMGATTENALFQMLFVFTEPLLRPVRRFIPFLGGFDIAAILIAILLKAIAIFLVFPMIRWGELQSLSVLISNIK